MSRQPVPFQGPLIDFENVMSRRYQPGARQSENRALLEILRSPDYRILQDTLEGLRTNIKDGKRRRGRPPKFGVAPILAVLVTALVLNLDLDSAHVRLFADDELRDHLGLAPLTGDQQRELSCLIKGSFTDPTIPSQSAVRDFVARWTAASARQEEIFEVLNKTMLRVAADAIHRHDLPTNWIAVDGTRARATTNSTTGKNADQGTAFFAREGETAFNQRHHYLAVLGSVPFVIDSAVTPPQGEITYWVEEGLPRLRDASDELATVIKDMRIADGIPEDDAAHRGLDLAAVATDGALANEPGIQALIDHRFHPGLRPQATPAIRGHYTADRNGLGHVRYPVRTDGAVLCPHCAEGSAPEDHTTMEHLAGEFGAYIKVRCPDATCPGPRGAVKIPLRAVDRNDHLPTTSASRGERNPAHISILPVDSEEYIARRFLATQRVEWTHAMFEQHYGLGKKNKGFDRRMISGEHRNRVWWALAAVIWNITLRLNLDEGQGTLRRVAARDHKNILRRLVKAFWSQDQKTQEIKELRREAHEKRVRGEHAKITRRNSDRAKLKPATCKPTPTQRRAATKGRQSAVQSRQVESG